VQYNGYMLLFNILSDSANAKHSVKVIDETLMWSDAGLEVWLHLSVLLTVFGVLIMTIDSMSRVHIMLISLLLHMRLRHLAIENKLAFDYVTTEHG